MRRPSAQVQRITTTGRVRLDEVRRRQIRLERPRVDERKRVHPSLDAGAAVQAALRPQHLLHDRYCRACEHQHQPLTPNVVLPYRGDGVGEVGVSCGEAGRFVEHHQ